MSAVTRRATLATILAAVFAVLSCQPGRGDIEAAVAEKGSAPAAPKATAAPSPAPSTPAAAAATASGKTLATPPASPATPPAPTGPGLILKDGTRIECSEQPLVAMGRVLFRTRDGIQHAISQDLVDLQKTQVRTAVVQQPPKAAPAPQLAVQTSGKDGVPDFEAVRPDGTKVKLSDLKGKVVLVDFWATWCMPCMMEMPAVKATYDKLKSKDFEIVGVSLDHDRAKMDAYLKQQSISWPQYFDGQGWGNKVSRAWGINSIPRAILLDRKGAIHRPALRGGELESAVKELLAK